jgi:hypothetical protein
MYGVGVHGWRVGDPSYYPITRSRSGSPLVGGAAQCVGRSRLASGKGLIADEATAEARAQANKLH